MLAGRWGDVGKACLGRGAPLGGRGVAGGRGKEMDEWVISNWCFVWVGSLVRRRGERAVVCIGRAMGILLSVFACDDGALTT